MLRLDYENLYQLGDRFQQGFQQAQPFPHIVLDDFLDCESYQTVRSSFPAPDDDIWKKPENHHTRGKFVTRRGPQNLKERLYSEAARRIFFELNSSSFLRFLEILTGISGLIPDPYFAEGGFHCSESGGFLDIHADFSHHDHLKLERRLNFILYINEDWREEYGGGLSLYNPALEAVTTFLPIANRCVVFETSDTSYHGHPTPMKLPAGVYRRSIALYYYSVPRESRKQSRILFPSEPTFQPVPGAEVFT